MHTFRVYLMSMLLVLVLVLAACGGDEQSTSAQEATEETEEATEETEEATEETEEATEETEPEAPPEQPETSEGDNTISMTRATWNTGWFQALVYAQLLEELGYEVTVEDPISAEAFYPAAAEHKFDLWVNGWFPLHDQYLQDEQIGRNIELIGSQVRGGALQGYLIDKATADGQDIRTLEDLQNPEVAALFDSDGNGKADLIGCNEGWGCAAVIEHHLDAYDLRDTVEHMQAEYDDLMQETIDRYEDGEPVLFYTWTPNWPLNELQPDADVMWLEVPFSSLPEGGQEDLTLVPDIEGCRSNPCNLGFPLNDIRVAANQEFLDANPSVQRLLELVQIPLEDISAQNATMFFGEDSPEDIQRQAESWIAENDVQVREWLTEAAAWEEMSTLERVRERGAVRCGISDDLPGFGNAEGGSYSGFNADFCRAVATAVVGDAEAVEFVPLDTSERFAAVSDRRVDVLFHNATWLATRDVGMNPPNSGIRLAFGPTIFHDGQRFLVSSDSGIETLADLDGRTICVRSDSSAEMTVRDQLGLRDISFELGRYATVAELFDVYERGGCDAVTSDTSELVARRAVFIDPDAHTILAEAISREPHSPVYNEGDAEWADVVNWSVFATIYAEELGVNAENVEAEQNSDNPDVARLLGQSGTIGERLGLSNDFAYEIIRQVGNYRDIYVNNIDPDVLPRGPNKTWNSPEGPGGLLSAPPFR